MNRKRILLKISGGSFKSDDNIFSLSKANDLLSQIKELHKKFDISLVIGGGNIFRGNIASSYELDRHNADEIGMLATIINGIILNNFFVKNGLKSHLFSALKIDNIIDEYTVRDVNTALNNQEICILVGGTGSAFFTTDTGAALRAAETKSDLILMGKNGTDGVFDKDPNKYEDAIRFVYLNYNDLINKNLKVMDHSALTLCKDNDIKIITFNINHKNSLLKAINKEIPITLIAKEEKYDWLK